MCHIRDRLECFWSRVIVMQVFVSIIWLTWILQKFFFENWVMTAWIGRLCTEESGIE